MEKNKMQAKQKIMLSLTSSLLISMLAGCTVTKGPGKISVQPGSVQQPQQNVKQPQGGSVAKRFQEPTSHSPTAVESAIELSQKYAKLSEEAAALNQENQDLITRNRQLKDQNNALEAQLQQTQKELTEANDLMIEMRIELNNWRTDILGFRDEMRDADTTQLQALLRILKILGGEVKEESAQNENAGSAAVSQTESGPSSSSQKKAEG
jgi:chromosome segregation ATPase